jgi:DNA-binding CsgD family transcriptional regulator
VMSVGLFEAPHNPLTFREQLVLHWASQGKTDWEIGKILNISHRTSRFHVKNAQKKLKGINRINTVALAFQNGLLQIKG